jgi:hypothetical protein
VADWNVICLLAVLSALLSVRLKTAVKYGRHNETTDNCDVPGKCCCASRERAFEADSYMAAVSVAA